MELLIADKHINSSLFKNGCEGFCDTVSTVAGLVSGKLRPTRLSATRRASYPLTRRPAGDESVLVSFGMGVNIDAPHHFAL